MLICLLLVARVHKPTLKVRSAKLTPPERRGVRLSIPWIMNDVSGFVSSAKDSNLQMTGSNWKCRWMTFWRQEYFLVAALRTKFGPCQEVKRHFKAAWKCLAVRECVLHSYLVSYVHKMNISLLAVTAPLVQMENLAPLKRRLWQDRNEQRRPSIHTSFLSYVCNCITLSHYV